MVSVAIVDYGMGNLRSVEQAIRHVAPDVVTAVTDDAGVIARADRVVFPGQGAMPDCMRELAARGLRSAVLDAARSKPFMGICIGLQMLFEHSAEGDVAGLGILPGEVLRFPGNLHDDKGNKLKVPHMGWNNVHHGAHALWDGISQDARFYFVHSYYVQPRDAALVQATSEYPVPFVCAVAQENLFAVQFHPEKSHAAGLKLLQNFVQWKP
ncbi:MAG: imidazole glycerol phosphate synthase subunit HisH [Gallionella sp.]|nr:imidazole glycerol phosphate synthase subunit HisH [Gallionella sp.]MDD4945932.1 imidazole glycerol phosphate synthase subunit HisH [Gallionella sp.]MDD5611412.1 imidazole glycerol phosphate synthase subunit HisH [Gallionella sp.]